MTLVEVLVAMVILSIGLLGLSSNQSNSAMKNFTAWKVSTAVNLGRTRIDTIQQNGYSQVNDLNGDCCNGMNAILTNADYYVVSNGTNPINHIYWNCCDNPAVPNTKLIRLFVSPNDDSQSYVTFNSIIPQID